MTSFYDSIVDEFVGVDNVIDRSILNIPKCTMMVNMKWLIESIRLKSIDPSPTEFQRMQRKKNKTFRDGLIRTMINSSGKSGRPFMLPQLHIRILAANNRAYIKSDGTVASQLIDGQQRSRTIIDYMDGVHEFPKGTKFKSQDGTVHDISKKKIFHLNSILKNEIVEFVNGLPIDIAFYGDNNSPDGIPDNYVCELFQILNNVNVMTGQEYRQASPGQLAHHVRDFAREFPIPESTYNQDSSPYRLSPSIDVEGKLYYKYLSPKDDLNEGLAMEEMYAGLIISNGTIPTEQFKKNVVFDFKKLVAKDALNGAYEKDSVSSRLYEKYTKSQGGITITQNNFKLMMKCFKSFHLKTSKLRSKLSPKTSIAAMNFLFRMFDAENIGLINDEKFMKEYLKFEDALKSEIFEDYKNNAGNERSFWARYVTAGGIGGSAILSDDDYAQAFKKRAVVYFIKTVDAMNRAGLVQLDSKRTFTKKSIEAKLVEQNGRCEYCGIEVSEKDAVGDHKHPWSKGGPTTNDNLAAACKSCNSSKSDTLEEDFRTILHQKEQMVA